MNEYTALMAYVPAFIQSSTIFQAVYNADGTELDSLNTNAADIVNQCFVNTATWGLTLWESFLDITTDLTKSYDYRRSVIMAKIRGTGTVTVAMIKNVAESFSNGEVTITESPGTYSFTITFVGTIGIPPNMSDLTAAIEEIKPAHLAFSYVYTYITWANVETYNHTWAEWEALNLTWDEFEKYKG